MPFSSVYEPLAPSLAMFIRHLNSLQSTFSPAAGSDYTTVTMTITFPAGTTELAIPVNTTDDEIAELPEDFTALLSNPSQGLAVGAQDTATVTITDNDGVYLLYCSHGQSCICHVQF